MPHPRPDAQLVLEYRISTVEAQNMKRIFRAQTPLHFPWKASQRRLSQSCSEWLVLEHSVVETALGRYTTFLGWSVRTAEQAAYPFSRSWSSWVTSSERGE